MLVTLPCPASPDMRAVRGFTLVELMVAVSVLAILASFAVPTFRQFTARQQVRAASFDLRTDLLLARSEALKRNRNVTIRPQAENDWQSGWVVVLSGDDTELRFHDGLGSKVSVDSSAEEIVFNGGGRVSSPAGTVQIGLAASGGPYRCLVLNASGMPSTYSESCT